MKDTVRVLHVCRTYFPDTVGGIEESIYQICKNSSPFGIESAVFTLSKNSYPSKINREEGIIYRNKQTFEINSFSFSIEALQKFKYFVDWADIINYHYPWPFADLLHFYGRVVKPSLITYHSDIIRQKISKVIYKPLEKRFLDSTNIIVSSSKNQFENSLNLSEFSHKVRTVPFGISDIHSNVFSNNSFLYNKSRFGEDFFLFVGVLRYYKGLTFLLDALENTNIKCIIAGTGPLENEVKQRASKKNLKNVKFLGYVTDTEKLHLFKLCKAVVFPSNLPAEAFGFTLLEAARAGKPLISTELNTGTSFVNINGETGFVVEPSNSIKLRKAILKLNNNDELAIQMGKSARMRYEKFFSGEKMGKSYAEIYRELKN